MSEEQLQFLDTAQKSDDFVFKQSDKCKGFVILNRGEYKSKSHAILDNSLNYEGRQKSRSKS